jgi:proteasome lid subunit RPN8/RPN11
MVKRKKNKLSKEKLGKKNVEPKKSNHEFNNIDIQWEDNIKPLRRAFPGPQKVIVPLRIAIDREAFADVTAHVLESIDEEICGVLAGEICEDDEGHFVHVRSIIRGASVRQGSAHVTFTQETWNHIHKELERNFPGFNIVGWYHSHPGFGVVFSEMDLFIQRNFFPSPTQFALVMDPLGGEKAVCVNTPKGIQYIDRFWVDGRENRTWHPEEENSSDTGSKYPSGSRDVEALAVVESRLSQVLQTLDKQNANIYRTLMGMITLFLLVIIFLIFYSNYRIDEIRKSNNPPEMLQYVPVSVRVEDKQALIGVGIVKWDIPPELTTPLPQQTPEDEGKSWFLSIFNRMKTLLNKQSYEAQE